MSITRRHLLATPALALLANELHAAQVHDPLEPAALGADDGELVCVGPIRDPVHIKVSPSPQGRFAMITQAVAPGSVIPLHLHEREDEIIFIRAGTGAATLGERRVELGPGSMLYVPEGTWHGGENTGDEVLQWVAIYSPSGFEGYFREIGISPGAEEPPSFTAESFRALNERYGIRYPA